jgi:CshA-type fibril repeat protein
MIAVTGYMNESETGYGASYYVLNPADTKIYALGGNRYGQLGVNNTNNQASWRTVQNTDDSGDLTGVIAINAQDNSNHYPTAGAIVNGFNDNGNTYDHVLLLWGSDSHSMIGGGDNGNKLLPFVPGGFTPGTSYAAKFELGGHTSMYYDPYYTDSDGHTGKMCYVGHKTSGSMGDGDEHGTEETFNCEDTPWIENMCAATNPPIAVDDIGITPYETTLTVPASAGILSNDSDPDGDDLNVSEFTAGGTTYTIAAGDSTTAELAEGNLTIASDGSYTFVPKAGFSGDVQDIKYIAFDGIAGDKALLKIHVDAPPVATNDDKLNQPKGNTVTLNVVTMNNGYGVDTDIDGSIDASTVDLDAATPGQQTTLTVSGEGNWSVANDGNVTFVPDAALVGDPTPITYTVQDNAGNTSNEATITVTY